ncbi:MAG: HAMP domain-containing histidine kinase [Clostridia bacterium]|nr:HAMP domain-containing histidine kinase [Clostridia bacterium]
MVEIIIIFALSAAVCALAAKLFILKRRIYSVSKQLDDDNNSLITIQLGDDELETVVRKINLMIESDHEVMLEISKEQAALKQAIADISHDIRTPLTSIVGYLQLAQRAAENEEQRANIDVALERARYCSALVNDFFELSVIDANGCEPVMEKVDVNDLICELILANYPNFETKGITPHFEAGGNPMYAQADRKMLTRVLQNLISNGIKYGGGGIEFQLSSEEAVHIFVSNSIGNQEIDTERLFDKFYRANRARTADGAGIGLYICKQLVQAMGGSISANVNDGRLTIAISIKPFHDER